MALKKNFKYLKCRGSKKRFQGKEIKGLNSGGFLVCGEMWGRQHVSL